MNTIPSFLLALLLATASQVCSATSLRIVVFNTPKGADSIEVAASGQGFLAPVLATSIADPAFITAAPSFLLELPDSPLFYVRAIALGSSLTGRIFPFVLAAAAATVGETGTITLDFAANPLSMTIDQIKDCGDGTVIVPVAFSGGGEFFKEGQVVTLWAGARREAPLATGEVFFAPLVKGTNATILQGLFKVPLSLAKSYLQPGYHALDFRRGAQIPLLIGGSREALLSQSPTSASSNQSGNAAPTTAHPESAPGAYIIVPGTNGRLVRVWK